MWWEWKLVLWTWKQDRVVPCADIVVDHVHLPTWWCDRGRHQSLHNDSRDCQWIERHSRGYGFTRLIHPILEVNSCIERMSWQLDLQRMCPLAFCSGNDRRWCRRRISLTALLPTWLHWSSTPTPFWSSLIASQFLYHDSMSTVVMPQFPLNY